MNDCYYISKYNFCDKKFQYWNSISQTSPISLVCLENKIKNNLNWLKISHISGIFLWYGIQKMRLLTKEGFFHKFWPKVCTICVSLCRQAKCIFQQSAPLCGWRHKRSICLSQSHAIFIGSNANYRYFFTGHAHNWKNWPGFIEQNFFVVYYTMQDGCTGHCALYKFGSIWHWGYTVKFYIQ